MVPESGGSAVRTVGGEDVPESGEACPLSGELVPAVLSRVGEDVPCRANWSRSRVKRCSAVGRTGSGEACPLSGELVPSLVRMFLGTGEDVPL